MAAFILKIILGATVIVGFVVFRIPNFHWSLESITAVGTLLTGVAALLAVFAGFYTMQTQVKRTTHADWLKLFRLEAANMLTLSQKIQQSSGVEELSEFNKSSMSLMLLLNQTFTSHRELEILIKDFNIFMMEKSCQNAEFVDRFAINWKIVFSKIKDVIHEEERR